jgi:hypothetical protein
MRHIDWRIKAVLSLLFAGAVVYIIVYAVRGAASDVLINLATDITLIPVAVFVMKLLIDGVLTEREKHTTNRKMSMVVGAFFSEVGTSLIERFRGFDVRAEELRGATALRMEWADRDFLRLQGRLREHGYGVDSRSGNLEELKAFMTEKRDFMVRLLENPNVLEQESFSDLLWAVFHLNEELAHRKDLGRLSPADYEHLSGDMRRAYGLLAAEWAVYLRHLHDRYPYLFSLAVRTNPFDPQATAEIV